MKTEDTDLQQLVNLVHKAGFPIPAERFNLLLPELAWIMDATAQFDSIDLAAVEPLLSYTSPSLASEEC